MPKVLLIGWDAADWKVINPLLDAGLMPSLQSLIEGGARGRMATLDPPLSPTLWTSIATGKRPYKHGIHGFTEPDPLNKSVRPVFITSRKCKAIWNILTQHQKKTHVVGWWPSHPAEPINGVMVSNFYQRAEMRPGKQWRMPDGTVHPANKADIFAKLRLHPSEITSNHIAEFVPGFEKVDQKNDNRLLPIAKNLADCSCIHNAATYIMENEEWDFLAVYYDAIDHFCHGYMRYHPPRQAHIPVQDYELYKDVVSSAYRFHDMMLGRLLDLAGPDTTVMLISDHGFHPDHNRPKLVPDEPTGPAIEHSPYGIVVMKGPGIIRDELLFGASLLDVTPTLLHIFGLPAANDMDGKVLIQAFEDKTILSPVQSWENINGEDGRHPENLQLSEEEMHAELQQLIELGYIKDPGENKEQAIKNTVAENNFNLARAYYNGQQWKEGISVLEKLHNEYPQTLRYATYLVNGYLTTGAFRKARILIEHIRNITDRESPQFDILEGTLLLAEGRTQSALALFQKAEKDAGDQPQLQLRIGNAYLQLNQFSKAESVLHAAIKTDPEDFAAWYSLGICSYNTGDYEKAVKNLLRSIGLQYYYPPAHFYLGESLLAMQRYEDAANAFDICLRLAPAMNMVRDRLIAIYEQFLNKPGLAHQYKIDFDKTIKGEITIVSGLPRSGTSMMMQMLKAGGLALFADNERLPDENNKKGYYEHELVKNLAKNKSWLPDANGKVVKIVAQLLQYLPMNFRYNIIFMERPVGEVISSQQKMLARDGKNIKSDTVSLELINSFEKTIKQVKTWAAKQPNVQIIYVDYNKVVNSPFEESIAISAFLNNKPLAEAMALTVDATMRREHQVPKTS